MKTVTFQEYNRFMLNNLHLMERIIDGKEICACQWLDSDGVVQAQAIYQKFQPIGLASKTYQIRSNQIRSDQIREQ